jgi:sulfite reductase (NADPH) flavoprotein alpha-component
MLSDSKLEVLHQLLGSCSTEEIIWTQGYLTGLLKNNVLTQKSSSTLNEAVVFPKITVVYASETGNSKKVALQVAAELKKSKIKAKTVDIQSYTTQELAKEELILLITSTQGDGELPQTAIPFYEKLTKGGFVLENLKYAIFALGDSSYPLFCNAGVMFDEAFTSANAKAFQPVLKADTNYQEEVLPWINSLISSFTIGGNVQNIIKSSAQPKASFTKKNYLGRIKKNIKLNDTGSFKKTHHVEITCEEDIDYLPGDALGMIPFNSDPEISQILDILKTDKESKIKIQDKEQTAYQWLKTLNIKGLSPKIVISLSKILNLPSQDKKIDLLPLLLASSEQLKAEEIFGALSPIAPRLYSIASAPTAHEGEVHLTVALNTFEVNGVQHKGLASDFLVNLPSGSEISFYIHKNDAFRLPVEESDIIMIGPGTGIAPFRSFLAHRDAEGHEGKNWLFFGEQQFAYDFYYQTEIQEWLATGTLTKFSGAFSRDQKQKIYVQNRIFENSKEFNQWILDGASIYICGQKDPMSIDVEQTIIEVLSKENNISLDEAKTRLQVLEEEGRYHKDVY